MTQCLASGSANGRHLQQSNSLYLFTEPTLMKWKAGTAANLSLNIPTNPHPASALNSFRLQCWINQTLDKIYRHFNCIWRLMSTNFLAKCNYIFIIFSYFLEATKTRKQFMTDFFFFFCITCCCCDILRQHSWICLYVIWNSHFFLIETDVLDKIYF